MGQPLRYCYRCKFLKVNALIDDEGKYSIQWTCYRHKKVVDKFGYCRYWRVSEGKDYRKDNIHIQAKKEARENEQVDTDKR